MKARNRLIADFEAVSSNSFPCSAELRPGLLHILERGKAFYSGTGSLVVFPVYDEQKGKERGKVSCTGNVFVDAIIRIRQTNKRVVGCA
jgi:hypothetical protein